MRHKEIVKSATAISVCPAEHDDLDAQCRTYGAWAFLPRPVSQGHFVFRSPFALIIDELHIFVEYIEQIGDLGTLWRPAILSQQSQAPRFNITYTLPIQFARSDTLLEPEVAV
jgi:hypothetical protein